MFLKMSPLILTSVILFAVLGCKDAAIPDPKNAPNYTATSVTESPDKATGWLLMARLLVKDTPNLSKGDAQAIAADYILKNKALHNAMKFTVIGLQPENPGLPGVEQAKVIYSVKYASSANGARAVGLPWEGKDVFAFMEN